MNADTPRPFVTSRMILGVIVVGLGLAFLFDNLGVVDAGRLIRYWPFALMAIGLTKLLQDGTGSGRTSGGILLVVGALFAADHFVFVRFDVWRWWPLAIVAFGLLIVVKAFGNRDAAASSGVPPMTGQSGVFAAPASGPRAGSAAQTMNEVAIWSGVERRVSSPAFKRANLTAIMGGIEFDLRQAGTDQGEAVIDVFVIWGGIEITVPPDWAVSNEVTAIMGGAEDQSTGTQQARHRLIVRGVVIMGGVDIKT